MKKQKRWMKSAIDAAKAETPALPWQRGTARKDAIARRDAPTRMPRLRSA